MLIIIFWIEIKIILIWDFNFAWFIITSSILNDS